MARAEVRDSAADRGFLPDFCGIRMVLGILVGAELLAIVVTLEGLAEIGQFFNELSLRSLFIQWVALSGALLLCSLRPLLRRIGAAVAGVIAWVAVIGMAAAVIGVARVWMGAIWPQLDDPGFMWRTLVITAIVSALMLRYLYIQHLWRRQVEAEAEARFEALQARIRPHFLFNSMNTIAHLTRSDPVLAERVVVDLAYLFRASLSGVRRHSTLGEELDLARGYLGIEGARLGDRLRVEWQLGELPQEAVMPPLVLQPLIENAVYHGIEPAPAGGRVRIEGGYAAQRIEISICNTLPPDGAISHREGNRIALDNTRQRLRGFFGDRASLTLERRPTEYCLTLRFPHPRGLM